jgi:hypothetical protein
VHHAAGIADALGVFAVQRGGPVVERDRREEGVVPLVDRAAPVVLEGMSDLEVLEEVAADDLVDSHLVDLLE